MSSNSGYPPQCCQAIGSEPQRASEKYNPVLQLQAYPPHTGLLPTGQSNHFLFVSPHLTHSHMQATLPNPQTAEATDRHLEARQGC